ncbi:MAG: serine hydrolase domain-containing protein [Solirubrobacteraceae bacterium]|jgi:CubicO group peptidase (beta-lactamase class C family)
MGRAALLMLAAVVLALGTPSSGLGAPASVQPSAASAEADGLQAVLDSARQRSGAPGAQAAIMLDGRLIWAGSSGFAILDGAAPVTPSTLFGLASVTKTYTAALTLRLVEAGRLGLDDTVGQWLGRRVVAAARETTVRQLLQMTSGLPDYLSDPALAQALEDPNHRWTENELLRAVSAPSRVGRFAYSNTNYVLLGAIDARAAGASVGALLSALILQPLGLQDTYIERVNSVVARFAHGYEFGASGIPIDTFAGARTVPTSLWGPVFTDGGIAATATDVARFADGLYLGGLLAPEELTTMLTPGPDGSYGMGTYTYPFNGHLFQGHNGAFDGFSSDAFTDIERGVTIVALANGMNRLSETDPADVIWRALARAYDDGAR